MSDILNPTPKDSPGDAPTPPTTATTPAPASAAPATPAQVVVRGRGLRKTYGTGDATVHALDGVDVDFERGKFTAIMGPSGSGKSTLLHVLAGLDTVTSGTAWIADTEITALTDRQLTQLRRRRVGFVFQSFNLLPMFTAADNITMPSRLAGTNADPEWIATLTHTLGLTDRLQHKPHELSGGQQQRVAIARALSTQPDVIFADEPTGNLDSRSGAEVLAFLRQSVRELGQTVIMVTHDPAAAAHASEVILIADGVVAGHISDPTPEAVLAGLDALRTLDSVA